MNRATNQFLDELQESLDEGRLNSFLSGFSSGYRKTSGLDRWASQAMDKSKRAAQAYTAATKSAADRAKYNNEIKKENEKRAKEGLAPLDLIPEPEKPKSAAERIKGAAAAASAAFDVAKAAASAAGEGLKKGAAGLKAGYEKAGEKVRELQVKDKSKLKWVFGRLIDTDTGKVIKTSASVKGRKRSSSSSEESSAE